MPKRNGRRGRLARKPRPERPADRRIEAAPRRPVRLAVAAGPALLREVLCRALASEPGVEVVGDAGTEDAIAALLREARPDVLLFDYEALGPNGEGLISRLRRGAPAIRVLVLATRSGPETVEGVLQAGASGLVGKESDFAMVVRAIGAVARGEVWANRRVTASALEHLADASRGHGTAGGGLTAREEEIANWVARGLRNKEIAHRLEIHEKTVKTHLNNIFRKLRVDNRIALALRGFAPGGPKA
jgi:DNA-binding NarL/FixJ family response regulator